MAEDPKIPVSTGDAPREEQDTLFRVQVGVTEFVLANVKYVGYAAGVVLVGTLVYGLWDLVRRNSADEDFSTIAAIDYKMPKGSQLAQYGLAPMDDPADTARMANVEEGARRYRAAAGEASGTAAVMAHLRAASAWERAGKRDEALVDLRAAWELGEDDLPGFAAASHYARVLTDAEKRDEAIAVLREEATREKGIFAEEALLLLVEQQIAAGRAEEAKNVISEFTSRFPDSPRSARLAAVQARVGG